MDSPPPSKRQLTMSDPMSFNFEEGQNNDDEPMDVVHEKMKEFQTARKVQDFKAKAKGWKEVIDDENDQQLMGQFQTCAVQETLVIDRGSESYYVRNRVNRTRKRKLPNAETETSEEKIPATNYDSDHSDISNTGLDDEDLEHLKKHTEKNVQLSADLKKIKGCVGDITAGQTMLKKKSLSRMDELLKGVNDQRLPIFICRQLAEKKTDLIRRCISKLGRDYCIKMLRKTLKIEAKGGLLIKSQTRRRTPGGTFFKIIRTDPNNSKEVLDEIFIVNPSTQNEKQDVKASGNVSVAQSIFDRIRERKPPSNPGVNPVLEKRRQAVAEKLDLESYSVKPPPPPAITDPRARKIVTYDDDLFS